MLDVYGEHDLASVLKNAAIRATVATASGGQQHRLPGADHFYAGREAELVALIAAYAGRK